MVLVQNAKQVNTNSYACKLISYEGMFLMKYYFESLFKRGYLSKY
jgi:hypothetical protein